MDDDTQPFKTKIDAILDDVGFSELRPAKMTINDLLKWVELFISTIVHLLDTRVDCWTRSMNMVYTLRRLSVIPMRHAFPTLRFIMHVLRLAIIPFSFRRVYTLRCGSCQPRYINPRSH